MFHAVHGLFLGQDFTKVGEESLLALQFVHDTIGGNDVLLAVSHAVEVVGCHHHVLAVPHTHGVVGERAHRAAGHGHVVLHELRNSGVVLVSAQVTIVIDFFLLSLIEGDDAVSLLIGDDGSPQREGLR